MESSGTKKYAFREKQLPKNRARTPWRPGLHFECCLVCKPALCQRCSRAQRSVATGEEEKEVKGDSGCSRIYSEVVRKT